MYQYGQTSKTIVTNDIEVEKNLMCMGTTPNLE